MRRKYRFRGGVIEVVAHVGEEGAAWFQQINEADGLFQMRMAGMRIASQRVENKDIEVLKQGNALRWNVAHIGKVSGAAESVAGNLLMSMGYRNAAKACPEEIETRTWRCIDAVDLHAGACRITVFLAKRIVEDSLNRAGRRIVRIDWKIVFGVKGEWTQIVEAHDMIGVSVSIENRIEMTDSFAERLSVKVRTGVNDNGMPAVIEPDGRPGTAIPRVARRRYGRRANGAIAAQRRHTHGCAATEKSERRLHRLADDAWLAGSCRRFCRCRTRKSLGDFEKTHAKLKEGIVQKADFFGSEISLGFLGEHS